MPGGASQTRKELDGWQDWAKARGAKGLAYVVLDAETGEARGPVAKNLSAEHLAGLADAVGAKPGDAVFFAAATERREAQELLGAARIEIAKRAGLIDESGLGVLLGRRRADVRADRPTTGGGRRAGPRCTTPSPRRTRTGSTASSPRRPGEALAYAYDIVCNGNEIGGGSVRIHRATCRSPGLRHCSASRPTRPRTSSASCSRRSSTGRRRTPASRFGWDRICMLLGGYDSIREVIAFPKTRGGFDPLTSAPTPITTQQRLEAGIDAKPKSATPTPGTDGVALPVEPTK